MKQKKIPVKTNKKVIKKRVTSTPQNKFLQILLTPLVFLWTLIKELFKKLWAYLLFCLIVFGIPTAIKRDMLSSKTKYIHGIVIDEAYNSTRYRKGKIQKHYYLYAFWLNGKKYTGPTGSLDYYVGDSVKIKYSILDPEYNELVGRP